MWEGPGPMNRIWEMGSGISGWSLAYLLGTAAMLWLMNQARRSFWLFSLLVLPGTLCHEFCHWMVGKLLNARPVRFTVVPRRAGGSLVLGCVEAGGTSRARVEGGRGGVLPGKPALWCGSFLAGPPDRGPIARRMAAPGRSPRLRMAEVRKATPGTFVPNPGHPVTNPFLLIAVCSKPITTLSACMVSA